MSYQKPVNPQRFDEPVYEQMNPKEKAQKKGRAAIRQQQAKPTAPAKRRKPGANIAAARAKPKSWSL